MPTFVYNALDATGRSSRGTLTADSRSAALSAVAGRGLVPVSLEATEASAELGRQGESGGFPGWQRQSVSAAQVEAFTRELANLLAAGVPLGRALHILQREAGNPAARRQWSAVHDDVVGGKPLAEALARWPKSFPKVYIAMVRAGEMGGFLELVLNQIADFRSRESELKGRVKSALVYPCVLATLAVGVLIFLLTFFIPRFSGIFADFGASLPVLTQVIIAVSHAMSSIYALFLAVGVAVAVFGVYQWVHTDAGRRTWERWLLATPALGVVLARFALVRFARMLGTLLAAGVPLVTALRVAQDALGNQTLSDAVALAIDEVKRGSALSRSLGACERLFPGSVVEMIAVAEESGRLDKELLRLAQSYEGELDRRLRMLVALAEPALLFLMAGFVGTIVVGMLLPIFTLQEIIK